MSSPTVASPRVANQRTVDPIVGEDGDARGGEQQDKIYEALDSSSKRKKEWRRQYGVDESSVESQPGLRRQAASQIEPGNYYLPPFTVSATRNEQSAVEDGLRKPSLRELSESDRGRREDVDKIVEDCREENWVPAELALPESGEWFAIARRLNALKVALLSFRHGQCWYR